MKKIIAILLTVPLLIGSLIACSSDAPQSESVSVPTEFHFSEDTFSAETSAPSTEEHVPTEVQPIETQVPTLPSDVQPSTESAEETLPAQPTESTAGATEPSTQPTDPTVNQPTEPAVTEPALDEAILALAAEYEAYVAMNSTEKATFQNSFSNYDAFFNWYNAARDAYNQAHPPVQISPNGVLDLG